MSARRVTSQARTRRARRTPIARRPRIKTRKLAPAAALTTLTTLTTLTAIVASAPLLPHPAAAQVVLDPTFSNDTVGPGEYAPGLNTDYLIRESYGQRQGSNLYHRFVRFDVPTGTSATFIEDAPGSGIQRIISHVGGTTPSMIDGVIRSTIPGADLYLFNSRGVIFGPNASLDVLGAFHVSSANRIRFGASEPDFGIVGAGAPVTLSAAAPAAWGFLSAAPAEVAVEGGSLSVRDGHDLSVVGGADSARRQWRSARGQRARPVGPERLASARGSRFCGRCRDRSRRGTGPLGIRAARRHHAQPGRPNRSLGHRQPTVDPAR